MDRRTALKTLAGAGVALGIAGCTGRSAPADGGHDIGMSTRRFRPANLEVAPGTTVVWRNTSSHAHTVTAYADRIPGEAAFFASGDFEEQRAAEGAWFDSGGGALYSGDEFEHTFTVPGDYTYYCIPHEMSGMVGTIIVSDDADQG